MVLECASGSFELRPGMYFAVPGAMSIAGGDSIGIVVTRIGYLGFFQLGGPIERTGRLRYIDGCTDSLLVAPVLKGDPCLNLLHIPPGIEQTAHTHPSHRIGLIVDGAGECVTPGGSAPLKPGSVFVIPSDARHHFVTAERSLLILAYHPDSDFGPTHDDHPMLNRTLVDGQTVAGERTAGAEA